MKLMALLSRPSPLMPAKAGIQYFAKNWVPAFAGTSGLIRYGDRRRGKRLAVGREREFRAGLALQLVAAHLDHLGDHESLRRHVDHREIRVDAADAAHRGERQ